MSEYAAEPASGRQPLPPGLSPRGRRSARPPRSGAGRGARWASWLAVATSLIVLVTAGGAYAYYRHLDGNITRIPVFRHLVGRAAATKDGAENILVVGDDSRVGETAAQLAEQSTTADGGSTNTDTIIVLHLAPGDGPATLVSIPRDSFVPIRGHGTFKINSAYPDGEADHKGGGPALLTHTVEDLTGLHIDHFVSVGLGQFIDISKAIGGVKVCISTKGGAHDRNSGTDLPYGVSTISGGQALSFVRQRDSLPNGDLDRIKRQQRFLTAVTDKAKTERSPATVNNVLGSVTKSLTVDSGLSLIDLGKLGQRLASLPPADIRFTTVPVANIGASTYIGGQQVSYVQLDHTRLPIFFANLKAERDPNAPAATTPAASVGAAAPADTQVSVLNGSGVTGGAGKARTDLRQYGFAVTSVGNASRTSSTEIRYGTAGAAAAKELAKAVPDATLVPTSSLASAAVELVLGSDFTGVQDPANAAAPSSSPPVPSPSASRTTAAPGTITAGSLLAGGSSIDGVPCGP